MIGVHAGAVGKAGIDIGCARRCGGPLAKRFLDNVQQVARSSLNRTCVSGEFAVATR